MEKRTKRIAVAMVILLVMVNMVGCMGDEPDFMDLKLDRNLIEIEYSKNNTWMDANLTVVVLNPTQSSISLDGMWMGVDYYLDGVDMGGHQFALVGQLDAGGNVTHLFTNNLFCDQGDREEMFKIQLWHIDQLVDHYDMGIRDYW